jgi:N6-L-threonylcarbamoyladenine synthase
MKILGIESSCDETSAAVVDGKNRVRSNAVTSSLRYHKRYGGIIPEIAFRMQLETVAAVAGCALEEAGVAVGDIDGIAVTKGPGLLGSLLVGISFAKALSLSRRLPLAGVNHLYSHIYACFLNKPLPRMPVMALVVSGGHTSLFHCKDFSHISLVGSTRDDAAGEAFDKVAKILGLGYPGGPVIEKTARKGDPRRISFSCSNTKHPFDFSFSGIKTAVLYYVQKNPGWSSTRKDRQLIADICAGFQHAVLSCLVEKSIAACRAKKIYSLAVGGGVAANSLLREMFASRATEEGIELYFPPREFCMDNAAMVAGMGHWLLSRGCADDLTLDAAPTERG